LPGLALGRFVDLRIKLVANGYKPIALHLLLPISLSATTFANNTVGATDRHSHFTWRIKSAMNKCLSSQLLPYLSISTGVQVG
jgi:hypothetical protein